ncbi:MAG: protein kinase [archaeon]|nr:protein kinase [archaeon]
MEDPEGEKPPLVAVKVLYQASENVMTQDEMAEKYGDFVEEVAVMSCFQHPCLVMIFGYMLSPPSIVMEVLPGGTLYAALMDPLNLRRKVFEFVQALRQELGSQQEALSLHAARKLKWMIRERQRLPAESQQRLLDQCIACAHSLGFDRTPVELIDALYLERQIGHPLVKELERLHHAGLLHLTDEEWEATRPSFMVSHPGAFNEVGWQDAVGALEAWKRQVVSNEAAWNELVERQEQLLGAVLKICDVAPKQADHEALDRQLDLLLDLERRHRQPFLAPLSWPVRLKIALDVAQGMCHLHHALEPPLVHRDLRTGNIFLLGALRHSPEPDFSAPLAKVGDFGLSVRLSGCSLLRRSPAALTSLTPTWTAPEVLAGDDYSLASDVYSTSLVLYELATRRHPFQKEVSMEDFLPRFVQSGGRPAFLPEDDADEVMPLGYRELIVRCWHPDPAMRPSMQAVVAELIAIINSMAQTTSKDRPAFVALSSTLSSPLPFTSLSQRVYRVHKLNVTSLLDDTVSFSSSFSSSASYGNLKKPLTLRLRCVKCLKYTMGMGSHCSVCDIRICSQCLKTHPCITRQPRLAESAENVESVEDVVLRVTAILIPGADNSRLWFGSDGGKVGLLLDVERGLDDPSVLWSTAADEKGSAVTALCYNGPCFHSTWSGTQVGALQVWSAAAESHSELIDTLTMRGWLAVARSTTFLFRAWWVVLETGCLKWYKSDSFGLETGSLQLSSLLSTQLSDASLSLTFKDQGGFILRPSRAYHDQPSLSEWHRVINTVAEHSRQQEQQRQGGPPSSLRRLACLASASVSAPVLDMVTIGLYTCVLSADSVLSLWHLTADSDSHGLRGGYQLHPINAFPPLLAHKTLNSALSRSLHLISADTLWIATEANGCFLISSVRDASEPQQWPPIRHQLSAAAVMTPSSPLHDVELWIADSSGHLEIWSSDPKNAHQLAEISLTSLPWPLRLLQQISGGKAWAVTTDGQLLVFDLMSRSRRESPPGVSSSSSGGLELISSDAVALQSVFTLSRLSGHHRHSRELIWIAVSDGFVCFQP